MAEQRTFSGAESAAVLLMSVGEERAAKVLKHMGPSEVQKVGTAMSALSDVSPNQIGGVLQDMVKEVQGKSSLGVGSEEYVRNVFEQALGSETADKVIPRVLGKKSSKGLEVLKWKEPSTIAEVITNEHPQVIAIVLSLLEAEQGAAVVRELPEKIRTDVLMRVARMEGIPESALDELDRILEKQFNAAGSSNTSDSGGAKTVADILNFIGDGQEEVIAKSITEIDEALGQEIQELMFVFDDLKGIEDRGMQALLRDVSSDVLVIALKGADEGLKEKIFSNMSERAAEMMQDDLETKGPVKLSEVQTAQKEIIAVAQKMAEAGDLVLGGAGGEEYV